MKHKLLLKKSYEDKLPYPNPDTFFNSGIHLHSILDFSKAFEDVRISAGTFILDFTTIWYNSAGLSSNGSIRCTAIFSGYNLDVDAPAAIGMFPTTIDPGYPTPVIRMIDQTCTYWPTCEPMCFGWGMSSQVFWLQNSKDLVANPATGASVYAVQPGNTYYRGDNVCFAIQRGDCAYQADGDQDFFTVVEVYLYEP